MAALAKLFQACGTVLNGLFKIRKLWERWGVVMRAADGKESFYPVPTKQDALLITAIKREIEVKRRAELTQLQSHQYDQVIR